MMAKTNRVARVVHRYLWKMARSNKPTRDVERALQRLRPKGTARAVVQQLIKALGPILTQENLSGFRMTEVVYGVLDPIKVWQVKHGIEADPYDAGDDWNDLPWKVWETVSPDPYNAVP